MHKRSLRITMGLVFLALMLVGGLSVGVSLWATRAQQHDALILNLAGRQRMLSQKTAKEAWLGLLKGQDPHYLAEMHTTAHLFEEGLRALMDGGQLTYAGETFSVPPATDLRFRAALEKVQANWEPLHRAAHAVLENKPGNPSFTQGAADLERLSGVILGKMDEAMRIYQRAAEARVARLRWIQLASLLAGVAVLALGYRLVLAHVLRPVRALETAVRHMEMGDLDSPIGVKVKNELGRLAQAFERMRGRAKARLQEHITIMEIQREILEELDLERLLSLIIREATELTKAQSGTIYLYDETHQVFRPRAWHNLGEWIRDVEIPMGRGLTGTVAMEKRGIIANDYPNSPYAIPVFLEKHPIWSVIAQPLIIKDEVIGVITINDANIGRAFTQDDLELLGLFASHAAIAIENARLFEKELKRSQELAGLIKAGHAVSSSLSLENVLKSVVFLAAQVMNVSTCVLMLLDEKGEELICKAQIGLPEEWARDERGKVGLGYSGWIALEGRPLVILDMASDPICEHKEMARKYGFVSYLGVPVKAKERLIGVLTVITKKPRSFTEDEISLLSTFADQAAIAIENARLFESELKLLRETQEKKRLEEVSRIRGEFIAHVSHELRTPLNSIIGFSELLADGKVGELNEKQARYIRNVLESGRHLLNIINDIIDISKVDTGKVELRPEEFLLHEALETSLAIIRPQAERKGLTLRLDFDPRLSIIRADLVRFKQVMYNLLSNAIKFTPNGGSVTVKARLVYGSVASELVSDEDVADELRRYKGLSPELPRTTDYGQFIRISVTDTGIGIKPEDTSKLFKEFSQIESVYTKKYHGTGLGLSLTKRLVELHGGGIWAESEGEGRGSTFTFVLPLRAGHKDKQKVQQL